MAFAGDHADALALGAPLASPGGRAIALLPYSTFSMRARPGGRIVRMP
jgi:hypothetical protein